MPNPKCKYCDKELSRKTAYSEEYIDINSLKMKKRYFCNKECYEKFYFEDMIKDNFYSVSSEILNIDSRKNRYFKKRFNELKDKNKVFLILYNKKNKFLLEFENNINNIKKTKTINKNYEIAVYINMLETYSKEYVDCNKNEIKINYTDYIDYENLMPKGIQVKPRKTIFDEGE